MSGAGAGAGGEEEKDNDECQCENCVGRIPRQLQRGNSTEDSIFVARDSIRSEILIKSN